MDRRLGSGRQNIRRKDIVKHLMHGDMKVA
jgi:hypothetical protein